jgi:hypothetical protein
MPDMVNGGWYNGRQYWDGKLGEPGVVMNPGESGFNKVVSDEVIGQTNPANVAYIANERAKANSPTPSATPSRQSSSPGSSSSPGILSPSTPDFDISQIYQQLQTDSGVSIEEAKLSEMDRGFIEAKGDINDNPYLSEGSRSGREATLTKLHDERTANIRGDIATKKADIETQLNLQIKQFDINSQQAQQSFSNAMNLLQSGALDSASGESIAQLTMSTGIPSDMWYSAIDANKKKNVQTSMIQSTADSGEVTVSVINSDTGEVIKQTSLGNIGNQQGSGTGVSASDKKIADQQSTQQNAIGDIQRGSTLKDIINHYSVAGGLTIEELYRLYNSYSPYGQAKENVDDVKAGKFDY